MRGLPTSCVTAPSNGLNMPDMRAYKDLGHVHRGEPCQEYPGKWLVYYPGRKVEEMHSFSSFEEAFAFAKTKKGFFPEDTYIFPSFVWICWACSDNDPRIGEVWFTGFYRHGKFDVFGNYIS